MAANDLALILRGQDDLSHVLKDVANNTEHIGVKAGLAAAAGTAAFGLIKEGAEAVAGGFAFVIGKAAEFEAQMSAVQAVSGASAEDMAALSGEAIRLGAATAFSALEAAQGIEELVKGGTSVVDIMGGAAEAALNLAASAGESVADSAALMANVINVFADQVDLVPAHVADMVAGFANATTGSMTDFKFAMSSVGAVSVLAGQDFDQTAIAIGLMGQAGILGSDAGTSLKTMLMNLVPVTKDQKTAFAELGLFTLDVNGAMEAMTAIIQSKGEPGLKMLDKAAKDGVITAKELYKAIKDLDPALAGNADNFDELAENMGFASNAMLDAEGNYKDLRDISELLRIGTEGMSEAQATMALKTAFGTDAVRAAAIMAHAGAEGFDAMAEAMEGISAADVAATRLNNLAGVTQAFEGSIETAAIIIGTAFLPALTQLVLLGSQVLNDVIIPWATEHGPQMAAVAGNIGTALMGMAQTIGNVVAAMGGIEGIFAGFQAALPIIGAVVTALTLWGTVTVVTTAATSAMATAQALLNVVMAANPIGLVVIAIAALVAGLVIAYNTSEEFRNVVDAAWAGLQAAAEVIFPAIAEAIAFVVDAVVGLAGAVGNMPANVGAKFNEMGSNIRTALDTIGTTISGAFDGFGTTIRTALGTIGSTVGSVFDGIGATIHDSLDAILSTIGSVFSGIGTAIRTGIDNIGALYGAMFDNLGTTIRDALDAIRQTTLDVWEAIPIDIRDNLELIAANIGERFAGFGTTIRDALATIAIHIGDHFEDFGTIIRTTLDTIGSTIGESFDNYGTTINGVLGVIGSTIGEFFDGFGTTISGILDTIGSTIGDAFNGFGTLIDTALTEIATAISTAWSGFLTAISGKNSEIATDTETTWNGIMLAVGTKLGEIGQAVGTAFETLGDTVRTAWEAVSAGILEPIAGVLTGLATWVGDVLGTIGGLRDDAVQMALDIGAQIVAGVMSGLGAGAQALKDRAGEIARAAIDGMKEALGIHSASVVAGVEVGEPIIDGVVVHMVARAVELYIAARAIATETIDTMADATDDAMPRFRQSFAVGNDIFRDFGLGLDDVVTEMVEDIDRLAIETETGIWRIRQGWVGANDIINGVAIDYDQTIGDMVEDIERLATSTETSVYRIRQGWAGANDIVNGITEINTEVSALDAVFINIGRTAGEVVGPAISGLDGIFRTVGASARDVLLPTIDDIREGLTEADRAAGNFKLGIHGLFEEIGDVGGGGGGGGVLDVLNIDLERMAEELGITTEEVLRLIGALDQFPQRIAIDMTQIADSIGQIRSLVASTGHSNQIPGGPTIPITQPVQPGETGLEPVVPTAPTGNISHTHPGASAAHSHDNVGFGHDGLPFSTAHAGTGASPGFPGYPQPAPTPAALPYVPPVEVSIPYNAPGSYQLPAGYVPPNYTMTGSSASQSMMMGMGSSSMGEAMMVDVGRIVIAVNELTDVVRDGNTNNSDAAADVAQIIRVGDTNIRDGLASIDTTIRVGDTNTRDAVVAGAETGAVANRATALALGFRFDDLTQQFVNIEATTRMGDTNNREALADVIQTVREGNTNNREAAAIALQTVREGNTNNREAAAIALQTGRGLKDAQDEANRIAVEAEKTANRAVATGAENAQALKDAMEKANRTAATAREEAALAAVQAQALANSAAAAQAQAEARRTREAAAVLAMQQASAQAAAALSSAQLTANLQAGMTLYQIRDNVLNMHGDLTNIGWQQVMELNEISNALIRVPRFAAGGYVEQPTFAMIGEVPEMVIPMSKMGGFVGGGGSAPIDYDRLADAVVRALHADPLQANISQSALDTWQRDASRRGVLR